jgi:hypothetical protein
VVGVGAQVGPMGLSAAGRRRVTCGFWYSNWLATVVKSFFFKSIEFFHFLNPLFCLTCCRFALVLSVVLALSLVVLAAVFVLVANRLAVFAFLLFATAVSIVVVVVSITFGTRQLNSYYQRGVRLRNRS